MLEKARARLKAKARTRVSLKEKIAKAQALKTKTSNATIVAKEVTKRQTVGQRRKTEKAKGAQARAIRRAIQRARNTFQGLMEVKVKEIRKRVVNPRLKLMWDCLT